MFYLSMFQKSSRSFRHFQKPVPAKDEWEDKLRKELKPCRVNQNKIGKTADIGQKDIFYLFFRKSDLQRRPFVLNIVNLCYT